MFSLLRSNQKKLSLQWQGADIRLFLEKLGQRECAHFISNTWEEEDISSADSDVSSSSEELELDGNHHSPLLRQSKRLFASVENGVGTSKKAKIVVDKKSNSISFVLPLSAETQVFMHHMQEQYNRLKCSLPVTKVSP